MASGAALMPLGELGRVAYFRPDTLPPGFTPELMLTRHYAQRDYPFIFTNGVQASYVEVDLDTGFVKLLKHWAVEDCGRVINPMLVEGQAHGGIVQGIGQALMEATAYDEDGQLMTGSFMDYAVPHAADAPPFTFLSLPVPARTNVLGVKGCGEAGCAGALPAVMNALVDALSAHGVMHIDMPATPERIWTSMQG